MKTGRFYPTICKRAPDYSKTPRGTDTTRTRRTDTTQTPKSTRSKNSAPGASACMEYLSKRSGTRENNYFFSSYISWLYVADGRITLEACSSDGW